ncbi:MAG: hypothetical protein C1943_13270 [Halochromatium sp.]|nr:hypothetical protein [Halochromatium sp.]
MGWFFDARQVFLMISACLDDEIGLALNRCFEKQINGDQVNDILTHGIQLSARGMHNKPCWLQDEHCSKPASRRRPTEGL